MVLAIRMSASTTPGQYNELEDAFIADANFKVDISQKMKVPNKISFNNDAVNGISGGNWYENINMQVPERILVIGRDQHVGKIQPIYVKLDIDYISVYLQ